MYGAYKFLTGIISFGNMLFVFGIMSEHNNCDGNLIRSFTGIGTFMILLGAAGTVITWFKPLADYVLKRQRANDFRVVNMADDVKRLLEEEKVHIRTAVRQDDGTWNVAVDEHACTVLLKNQLAVVRKT